MSRAARDICGKRRAQGRQGNDAQRGACIGQNSLAGQTFSCLKDGTQKTYAGIGNDVTCKVGAEGDKKSMQNQNEGKDAPKNAPKNADETRDPQDLPEYNRAREIAQRAAQRMAPAMREAANAMGLSNAEQRVAAIPVNIDGVLIVHEDEFNGCGAAAAGCTVTNDDGTITRYAIIEKVVAWAATFSEWTNEVDPTTVISILAKVMLHESGHQGGEQSRNPVFDNFGNKISVEGAIEHSWMKRVDEAYYGPENVNFGHRPGIWMCEGESCSCGPERALIERIGRCLPSYSQQRSGRVTGREGGPIRDPTGEDIGTAGNGAFQGIGANCFGTNRALGVPLISTCAVLNCPGNQIGIASKSGGVESCSCSAIGIRPLADANIRLPARGDCPSGLCPYIAN